MFVYLYWTAGRIVMSYTGISTTILFLIVSVSVCVCVCVCVSIRPRPYISLSHSLFPPFFLFIPLSQSLSLSLTSSSSFHSHQPPLPLLTTHLSLTHSFLVHFSRCTFFLILICSLFAILQNMNKQYVGKDFSKNQSTDKLSPDKVRTFYIHLYIHFIFLFPGQPRTIHICSS